jgi:uncharacterized OsmC-like protein
MDRDEQRERTHRMYKATTENWGDTRFVATTRHASFVTDTEGKGANPIDTLLAALGGCMGHHVHRYFVARGQPATAFRVTAESEAQPDASRIEAISVRIEVPSIRLNAEEEAAVLDEIGRCKIYGTLREACRIAVVVVSGDGQVRAA